MSVPEIQVDELEAVLAAGAPLFDVRQPDEYAEARVPGAVLVPLGDVPEAVDRFPTSGPVYVICRSGARSMKAAELLRANGVDAVNVAGGTMAWVTSGRSYDSDAPTA
jgi:rhodanese-related sulfurtransferase